MRTARPPSARSGAALPGWSALRGKATIGTPRLIASRTVFNPAWVINRAARSSNASCGTKLTTSGSPGKSYVASRPALSVPLPPRQDQLGRKSLAGGGNPRINRPVHGIGNGAQGGVDQRTPVEPFPGESWHGVMQVGGQRADVVKTCGPRAAGKIELGEVLGNLREGRIGVVHRRESGQAPGLAASIEEPQRRPHEPPPAGMAQPVAQARRGGPPRRART